MTETVTDPIAQSNNPRQKVIMSGFGEPEPVLDGRGMFEYGYCPMMQDYYEYPFDIDAVSKLYRATSHHTSALITKRNVLASLYKPHPKLSRQAFIKLVTNLLVFDNAYVQVVRNRLGGVLELRAKLARNTRKSIIGDGYHHVDFRQALIIEYNEQVIHISNPDIDQELYGIPDYLSSVNAITLNEAATLFRRKYYKNGAHAGYILHLSDPLSTPEDVDDLEQAVQESKGAGNFKNLFMYVPNGKPDGVKVIPLAEVAAKDEFANIKIASRDDTLAGHRVPPQLMGVVPNNAGGFGDAKKAAEVFYWHEILPLQNMLLDINEQVGETIITFNGYELVKSD
ncbi:phage portal protein [Psychrobacter sp. 72-O-c]|uniref:phage portal protein n=1 Tax=Psychrobacter sp. 72-O-c TaxID=2774125 RepID=UPI001919A084|nr:phage portal protein [Psychrobacter sp. 72-O-c]